MTTANSNDNAIDWIQVHRNEYLFEDNCWAKCKSSFCCTNRHDDFNFIAIRQGECSIHYIENEYEFLSQKGLAPEKGVKETLFDYGGQKPLRVVNAICEKQGQCVGTYTKPLICRLYPFLPILDKSGALIDLQALSLFDQAMPFSGSVASCHIHSQKQKYLNLWQSNPAILAPIVAQPRLRLYLLAAAYFSSIYQKKMALSEQLKGRRKKEFWYIWEREFLTGQLIDKEELARKLAEMEAEIDS
jgi:hypothetical protein